MTSRVTDRAEVAQFRSLATDFCNIVRHPESFMIVKFLSELEKLLPSLCHAAQLLPPVERSPDYHAKWSLTEWKRLYERLRGYLSKYDSYYYVYEPYNPDDTEPVISSLSDDLTDICRDLSPGLIAWKRVGAGKRRAIVDDWYLHYCIHWGDHAATAWRAIHWLVHNHEVGTDDESFEGHRKERSKRKLKRHK